MEGVEKKEIMRNRKFDWYFFMFFFYCVKQIFHAQLCAENRTRLKLMRYLVSSEQIWTPNFSHNGTHAPCTQMVKHLTACTIKYLYDVFMTFLCFYDLTHNFCAQLCERKIENGDEEMDTSDRYTDFLPGSLWWYIQGSMCVCAQPIREDVTL